MILGSAALPGALAAPDALLAVERREHYGLVVDFGGVLVNGGRGLRAQVAIASVEIEGGYVMGAVGAGELHPSLNARDGVEALHSFECSPLERERKARAVSSEGNDW